MPTWSRVCAKPDGRAEAAVPDPADIQLNRCCGSPADIAPWLQAGATSRRPGGASPPPASVAAVIIYPRWRCYPASRAFAGEPDIVGRAIGLRQFPGGAGYLDRRLTLVTRDRFHPNADDLEIVGGVHTHFPALSLISTNEIPAGLLKILSAHRLSKLSFAMAIAPGVTGKSAAWTCGRHGAGRCGTCRSIPRTMRSPRTDRSVETTEKEGEERYKIGY
jgi:hypothetical protein